MFQNVLQKCFLSVLKNVKVKKKRKYELKNQEIKEP